MHETNHACEHGVFTAENHCNQCEPWPEVKRCSRCGRSVEEILLLALVEADKTVKYPIAVYCQKGSRKRHKWKGEKT